MRGQDLDLNRQGATGIGHTGSILAAASGTGEPTGVSCDELAEPFGDRVDGRLAGGDIDHEVVDVVVAGA